MLWYCTSCSGIHSAWGFFVTFNFKGSTLYTPIPSEGFTVQTFGRPHLISNVFSMIAKEPRRPPDFRKHLNYQQFNSSLVLQLGGPFSFWGPRKPVGSRTELVSTTFACICCVVRWGLVDLGARWFAKFESIGLVEDGTQGFLRRKSPVLNYFNI